MRTSALRRVLTHTHTHTRVCTQAHTCTQTQTCVRVRTHTCIHTHVRMHACAHKHSPKVPQLPLRRAGPHKYKTTRMCTCAHAHDTRMCIDTFLVPELPPASAPPKHLPSLRTAPCSHLPLPKYLEVHWLPLNCLSNCLAHTPPNASGTSPTPNPLHSMSSGLLTGPHLPHLQDFVRGRYHAGQARVAQ